VVILSAGVSPISGGQNNISNFIVPVRNVGREEFAQMIDRRRDTLTVSCTPENKVSLSCEALNNKLRGA